MVSVIIKLCSIEERKYKMIEIKQIDNLENLNTLKQQYMNLTTAPLDGMWMAGFVPMARHFGLYDNKKIIGYFCINDEGYLLQFHVIADQQIHASHYFDFVLTYNDSSVGKIAGAYVSTAEPYYLSLCLDAFEQFNSHTLMYQKADTKKTTGLMESEIQMQVVQHSQLQEVIMFAKDAIGAPEEWLLSYFSNLINREELNGYWKDGQLLATGECRKFDEYQTEYADLGFIVSLAMRGKGLGTQIFKYLLALAETQNLMPICSTEITNIGAQKAISRAGLIAGNRIIKFDI